MFKRVKCKADKCTKIDGFDFLFSTFNLPIFLALKGVFSRPISEATKWCFLKGFTCT